MLDVLIDVAVGLLVPSGRRRAKREARLFAAGGAVTFPACVLGTPSYCRELIVFLSASRTALDASPTEVAELHRRSIPVGRLELVRVRDRQRADPLAVQPTWRVAECRDGSAELLMGCAPQHMGYIVSALTGTA
ncbi:hypothetical protein [Streptomyces sp. NPDC005969]|uniref:hypothetical protein n=1 Tax=Streptomyces sp. NPDC005969 TaxID=3156722 RepID=UPI0033F0344F